MHNHACPVAVCIVPALLIGAQAFADGLVVDKIYDPYVRALERELEYRFIVQNDGNELLDGVQFHRLGLGKSWSDRWSSELYLVGTRTNGDSLSVSAYELEAKWQMTEQGEYWADWGLLFELEVLRGAEVLEYATTVLVSKESGRWITTLNAGLIYEQGDDINTELDTTLSVQGRYRLTRGFEPALEFYSGENTRALGPAFVGDIRAGGKRRLHWELGVMFGLDGSTADQTFRALLEFEF